MERVKSRLFLTLFILFYIGCVSFFYFKYIPLIHSFQGILIPLVLFVVILTSISVIYGSLILIFLIPIVNNLSYFFNFEGINPLLIIFLGYFLGCLIYQIFNPLKFDFSNPIFIPIIGFSLIITFSALITFWRYSNFFPLYHSTINELIVNIINVRAGEAIRKIVFTYINYLSGFLLVAIIINILKIKELIKKAIISLAGGTLISLFFGFYQYFKNPEFGNLAFWVKIHRINATFTDPNAFGIYLVLVIPLFTGALFAFKKLWKILFIVPLAGGIFLFPHIGSRSGFLGMILAGVFFLFFTVKIIFDYRKANPNLFKKLVIYLIISLLIVVLISSLILASKGSTLYKRFEWNLKVLSKQGAWQRVSRGRYYFWQGAGYMIKDHPLSGIGLGAFTVELPNYYKNYNILSVMPFSYYQKAQARGVPVDTAGNYYLQIASELGIIALFFIGWIFYLILRQTYLANFKQKIESGWNYLIAGISAGILAMLVIFLFGAHTLNFEIQLTFWLVVGLLFSLSREEKFGHKFDFAKKILIGVLITISTLSSLWNSTHSLSLQSRTEQFGLKQNFGFYQEEKMDGQEFRWSGKNAGITIKIEKPILVIPMLASHPDITKNPVKVKIYLVKDFFKEKKLLDEIVLGKSKWQEFKYDLSGELGSEVILLFRISRTWQPLKILGTPDPRNLGIAIGKIKFEDLSISTKKIEGKAPEKIIHKFSRFDWRGAYVGNLYTNSSCWVNANLPTGNIIFRILARGQKAKGEWPYMVIRLDDKIIGGEWVTSVKWQSYIFNSEVKAGIHKLSVEFINDYCNRQLNEDRNLYVGELKIKKLKIKR
ncbi:MAG: O-antigen ligase family protein [Candidatus Aminicenantia bacterium]